MARVPLRGPFDRGLWRGVFGYRRVSDGVPHMEAAEPRTGLLEDAAYPLAATRQYAVFACQGGWNRGTAAFGARSFRGPQNPRRWSCGPAPVSPPRGCSATFSVRLECGAKCGADFL
jgi:hypothetical protein